MVKNKSPNLDYESFKIKCDIKANRSILMILYSEIVKSNDELTEVEKAKMIEITSNYKNSFDSIIDIGMINEVTDVETKIMSKLHEYIEGIVQSHATMYINAREQAQPPTNKFLVFLPEKKMIMEKSVCENDFDPIILDEISVLSSDSYSDFLKAPRKHITKIEEFDYKEKEAIYDSIKDDLNFDFEILINKKRLGKANLKGFFNGKILFICDFVTNPYRKFIGRVCLKSLHDDFLKLGFKMVVINVNNDAIDFWKTMKGEELIYNWTISLGENDWNILEIAEEKEYKFFEEEKAIQEKIEKYGETSVYEVDILESLANDDCFLRAEDEWTDWSDFTGIKSHEDLSKIEVAEIENDLKKGLYDTRYDARYDGKELVELIAKGVNAIKINRKNFCKEIMEIAMMGYTDDEFVFVIFKGMDLGKNLHEDGNIVIPKELVKVFQPSSLFSLCKETISSKDD